MKFLFNRIHITISKDESFALMFDYNYMAKGFAYFDIYNFSANLNEQMKKYFLDEYLNKYIESFSCINSYLQLSNPSFINSFLIIQTYLLISFSDLYKSSMSHALLPSICSIREILFMKNLPCWCNIYTSINSHFGLVAVNLVSTDTWAVNEAKVRQFLSNDFYCRNLQIPLF